MKDKEKIMIKIELSIKELFGVKKWDRLNKKINLQTSKLP
jgi:hypothetical protein